MLMELTLHILDLLLFLTIAFSVAYTVLFALFSLCSRRKIAPQTERQNRFLVVFPAYAEDAVIMGSVSCLWQQDYPTSLFNVVVVADHMKPATLTRLRELPLQLLVADYHPSSKAKALQLAVSRCSEDFDYIVILDADNHVRPTFLSQLNACCHPGITAMQAHRMAKNTNTPVALLDAVSEEVNNAIFRKGHQTVGMSAALIGSGMCLEFNWFRKHVMQLSTAGEDKEIEEALLREKHPVMYLEDIPVLDEKVQTGINFGNQRRRWIAAQLYSLRSLFRLLPTAFREGNLHLIDKFVQHLLIPRSICLCLSTLLTVIMCCLSRQHGIKWIILTGLLYAAVVACIPRKFFRHSLFVAVLHIPLLVGRMVLGLFGLKGAVTHFIHTEHTASKPTDQP